MITDLTVQHELVKTALSATDNYLAVVSKAKEAKEANTTMLKDFIVSYNIAWKAFETLGILDQHEEYMQGHLNTMWSMANEEDATLADDPYSTTSGASGEMGESKEFYDSAKKRANEPKEELSPAWKAKAKARAAAAGREYPNLVDNVWAARKQESVLALFANFISEEHDSVSDEEIDEMVEALTWEDIVDLYDKADLIDEEVEYLEEGLTAQSRLKKRQAFARFKGKRGTAKGIKLRRASTPQVLQKRALLAARRSLYNRFLRGRDKSTLSASEKTRIEQQVKKLKNIQSSIAMRMVPKMRSIEQKRLAHYRGNK